MRRVLIIEHGSDGGIGHFGPWLRDGGADPVTVRPYRGEALPDLAGYDGLIVLGGEVGALDDEAAPWLPGVRNRLAAAVRTGLPALGICLGAQLLAAACGGEVAHAADIPGAEPEIGVREVTVDAAGDPLLGDLPGAIPATQWHLDLVARTPPGAVTLARTPTCPHQAYRLGERAWGVQFHPEVRRADFDGWNRSGAATLAGLGTTPEAVLAEYDARFGEINIAAETIATAFTKIVAEADARLRRSARAGRVTAATGVLALGPWTSLGGRGRSPGGWRG